MMRARLRFLSYMVPIVLIHEDVSLNILCIGVAEANWSAQYDLRVNLESKEKAVKLIYKASICQNTGEACFLEVLYQYHTDDGTYVELG